MTPTVPSPQRPPPRGSLTGWPWQYPEWWLAVILLTWGLWLLLHVYVSWDAPPLGVLGEAGERALLGVLGVFFGAWCLWAGYWREDALLALGQLGGLFVFFASGVALWEASGGVATALPFLATLWPWQVSVLAGTLTRVRLERARGDDAADDQRIPGGP
jgi:hypothetical protein